MQWYFRVSSAEYGSEEHGPYDTEQEAREGIDRIAEEAIDLNDDVERHFTRPYRKDEGVRKALMDAVATVSDRHGIGAVDALELLTDFLGFGDTGAQGILPEGTTVGELQVLLVELLEQATGRG